MNKINSKNDHKKSKVYFIKKVFINDITEKKINDKYDINQISEL